MKFMEPKRLSEIRAAIATGEIPDEHHGSEVSGDWQDFASELLDEVDQLRVRLIEIRDQIPFDDQDEFLVAADIRRLVNGAL